MILQTEELAMSATIPVGSGFHPVDQFKPRTSAETVRMSKESWSKAMGGVPSATKGATPDQSPNKKGSGY